MIAVEDRQITPAWTNSLRMLILLLSMAALVSLFRLADLAGQHRGAAPELSPAPPRQAVRVRIGGELLAVPPAAMRLPQAPGEGHAGAGVPIETQYVELALSWPGLEPLAPGQRGIHLSLSARHDPIEPMARFRRILMPLFEREVLAAPGGLTGRRLSAGSGYGGEILYFDPALPAAAAGDAPYYARCPAARSEAAPASCLRALRLGADLQAVYRFDAAMLADWRRIDGAVKGLIARMRRP